MTGKVLIFLALSLTAAGALAAEAPAARRALPPPPPEGVLDDAKLLDAQQMSAIRGVVQDFRKHRGVEAAFVAFTIPPGEDARQSADLVRAAWFKERPAVVIVYSRRDLALGLSHSGFLEENLTSPELMMVIRQAGAILDPTARPDKEITGTDVSRATIHMFRSLDDSLAKVEEGRTPPSVSHMVVYLAYVALGVLALALPVALVFRRKNAERSTSHETWLFPDVKQPMRLGGAFHGGGGVTLDHASGKAGPVHAGRTKVPAESKEDPQANG